MKKLIKSYTWIYAYISQGGIFITKTRLSIFLICIIFLLSGCSINKENKAKDIHFYSGQSDSWLATYSIIKAKSSYYTSLSIQYIFDDEHKTNVDEKIGPIEYILEGDLLKHESSYPQELEGVGTFHVGSSMNADYVKINLDDEVELTVKWQDNEETFKLKK